MNNRPAPRSAWALVALGAFLGATVATGVSTVFSRRNHSAPPPTPAPFAVESGAVLIKGKVPFRFETAAAEVGPPLPRNPVTARVATREQLTAPTYAPLEGRVAEVAVHLGTKVQAGDKLVLVRSGDLASMQRDVSTAQLAIKTKQTLVDRLKQLVESRAASQNELLVATSELDEARLVSHAAAARLRSLNVKAQGDIGYWIMAPRAGTVVQMDAAPGKQVGPDRDHPVATIADIDEVLVVADLPQKDAAILDPGGKARVSAPGQQEALTGTIESVSDVLDPERQTVPVRVRVANAGHLLRPHAFVEAVFSATPTERVVLVPAEAVVSDGATAVVFVETAPGALRRRVVQVGRRSAEQAEILTGLSAGERVVVRGALLLLNALDIQGLTHV